MPATYRFLRAFLRPRGAAGAVVEEETRYERDGEVLPATLFRPARQREPLPGWMTLHGLTASGRAHPSLRRFARALAASGSVVLVPDLPEWRALSVAPRATAATIRAAVLALDGLGHTIAGRVRVMGFSFGATQALVAASDPALAGHMTGVTAWGGYADMRRIARFMFLGEHELDGHTHRGTPDPYGRWILAANYVSLLPEHAGDEVLAGSFRELALEAGRLGIMAWDPAMGPVRARVRAGLSPGRRAVFDLLESLPGPDQRDRVAELVERMADRGIEEEPRLEPAPFLSRVPVPVVLAHGRNDRLIPWTETVRLRRLLPPGRVRAAGITELFAHSFGERRVPGPGIVPEAIRFVRLLGQAIALG